MTLFAVGALAFAPAVQGQTFSVLHSFKGGADGKYPYAGLIGDTAGNLYGTTIKGGAYGFGTVFKVTNTGSKEAVLYSFTGGADGGRPYGGLVRDSAGNLYGTTFNGGDLSCSAPYGCGVVFKLDTAGNETVLHSFGTVNGDGRHPHAGLLLDAAGNLYGTTVSGGSPCGVDIPDTCGVVFKLDMAGNETLLHGFSSYSDGARPYAGLIQDAGGNLYGTTTTTPLGPYGAEGVVFTLDATGSTESVLYYFTGSKFDGGAPYAGLIRDTAGNLYGTTVYGGTFFFGVVFKLDTFKTLTVLYSFAGTTDGRYPYAGLIRDSTGNLYGTTQDGIVFKIDTAGNQTVLHSFTGGADGGQCYGGLVRDAAGNLYGTTISGGAYGFGVVYKIAP